MTHLSQQDEDSALRKYVRSNAGKTYEVISGKAGFVQTLPLVVRRALSFPVVVLALSFLPLLCLKFRVGYDFLWRGMLQSC